MKEELQASQKAMEKKEEEGPGQKLICPNCEIIYDFGSSCIQCGSPLARNISLRDKEAQEVYHQKSKNEKEFSQPPGPQEQKIKAPPENLICPACKFIYESGNTCVNCGTPLLPQVSAQAEGESNISGKLEVNGKPIQVQSIQEQLDGIPHERLICPTCKIIYERGDACVRCGSALVTESLAREAEKFKALDTDEVKKKETEIIQRPEAKKKVEEVKEESFENEIFEKHPTKKPSDDLEGRFIRPKKRKIDYRRLSLELGGASIMVLAGGYFIWSIYTHFIKEPGAKTQPAKEVSSPVFPKSSVPPNATATVVIPKETAPPPASNTTPSDVALVEALEVEKIKSLLENIRQANLQKDIDLFISCYASDFKDREGKKKATLDNWKKYDYLDLSYDLKNPLISGDTAKAKVEWLIKTSSKAGGQPQEIKTTVDVTLKKEEGGWKIKEVKQVG
jgi:ketosteroid isomerase-like protein/DNA-directed RNA polymerase subunit M/transcription elongation factor TFIIS